MHEILRALPPHSRVLDLGCAAGSFPASATAGWVVRVDQDLPREMATDAAFVRADASRLPFRDAAFDAIVSNHSLEHFTALQGALGEMRRVLSENGALFVAVPDAATVTDKLYRWLARGGGHVNAFTSEQKTAAFIAHATGLEHRATRVLYSSLSFLNRRNSLRPRPRRLILLGAGYEWSLSLYVWLSRKIDGFFGTRLSIYGWAFYFGNISGALETAPSKNVCVRCGSGSSDAELRPHKFRNAFGFTTYRCPNCTARNPLV